MTAPRRRLIVAALGTAALGVGVVAAAPAVEIVTIETDPIVITAPQGTFGTATVGISATAGTTPTALAEVHVVGTDAAYFTFPDLTCQDGQNCVFTTTGPMLTTSPATVTIAPSPAVGETSAGQALTFTNVGTGTLTFELAANDFASEWLFTPACTHAAPCQLTGTGATQIVTVQLRPDTHGAHDTTLAILTNEATNPNHSVQLVGAGHGAFVVVDEPNATTFSFGTIPRGQVGRQLVRLRDTGNDATVVTITAPSAPFAADATSVALLAAGTAMFEATCTSATPFDGAGDYLL
ncbi:MAG: hypothetical protein NT062_21240, partial [Proteobacteria bacterium]|nr:hypothetical protein [Pseudomonadota bacterium]